MQPNLLHSRIAVSLCFFVNGFLFANCTSRMPELQKLFGVDDAALGTILFCVALGSMCAMPVAGWITLRLGSHRVTTIAGILLCLCLPLLPVYKEIWSIRAAFFTVGALLGAMDVTMNGQAILVERLWEKVIFSSFHAVFSIGMALGALSGAIFSDWKWALVAHLQGVAFLGIFVVIGTYFFLIPEEKIIKTKETNTTAAKDDFWTTVRLVLPVALIAFCCMTGEGAMADWSAIYMNKIVGESEAMGAKAFGTYAFAMTLGRVFGDYFTIRLGKMRLILLESILCIAGLGLAISYVSVWTTFAGFFLVGLGVATIVPIAYSTAGNLKGISPSLGISIVTSIGYTGFFIAPPLIGYLSNTYDLRIGLCFVLGLFLLMFILINWLMRTKTIEN